MSSITRFEEPCLPCHVGGQCSTIFSHFAVHSGLQRLFSAPDTEKMIKGSKYDCFEKWGKTWKPISAKLAWVNGNALSFGEKILIAKKEAFSQFSTRKKVAGKSTVQRMDAISFIIHYNTQSCSLTTCTRNRLIQYNNGFSFRSVIFKRWGGGGGGENK